MIRVIKKLLFVLFSFAVPVWGISAVPSPEIVKKIHDYYLSEEADIILYKFKVCNDFNPSESIETRCGESSEGTYHDNNDFVVQVYLFAPYGKSYEISFTAEEGENLLEENKLKLEGAFRMVVPIRINPKSQKEILLKIFQDRDKKKNLLGEISVPFQKLSEDDLDPVPETSSSPVQSQPE